MPDIEQDFEVDVPELGTISFPAGTTPEQASAAIKKHLTTPVRTPTSVPGVEMIAPPPAMSGKPGGEAEFFSKQSEEAFRALPKAQRPSAGMTFLGQGKKPGFVERVRQNLSPLLGPTATQMQEEGVYNPETGQTEYKPLGGKIEQEGLIPGLLDTLGTPPEQVQDLRLNPDSPEFNAALTAFMGRVPNEQAKQIAVGLFNAGGDFAKFFATPLGAATMGSGSMPPWVQRLGKLYFAQQMARNVPEAASNLGEKTVTGPLNEAVQAGANLAGDIFFPAGLVKGSLGPQKVTPFFDRVPPEPPTGSDLQMPKPVYPPSAPKRAQPVTVPETPPEPQQGMTAVEEARRAGANTVAKVQQLFKARGLNREQAREIRNAAFPGTIETPPIPPLRLQTQPATPEVSDASRQPQATEVHGNVQPQPEPGPREMPTEEGGTGVQPQAAGGLSEAAPGEVPLNPSAADLLKTKADIYANRPPGNMPIEIRKADGTVVPGLVNGFYDLTKLGKGIKPSVAYKQGDGWTHGLLAPGDTIITPDATTEGLDAYKQSEKKPAAPSPKAEPAPAAAEPVEQPAPAPAGQPAAVPQLTDSIDQMIPAIKGGTLTKAMAHEILSKVYGGTMAEGKFNEKEMMDVVETALNRMFTQDPTLDIRVDAARAVETVKRLKQLIDKLPTQTARNLEQDKLQQFSTPPPLAWVVNWVGNLTPEDVVLEPSSGTGGIAAFAKQIGAKVIGNEISERRRELLKLSNATDIQRGHNAEHLNALLSPEIARGEVPQPTAVEMNPPFSHGAVSGVKSTLVGAQHVEQALKLLPPGGRLTAVVGEGMAPDRPKFRPWWNRIAREYNVRANIGTSGQEYRKYGTTFGNQVLVIDKTGPTPAGGTVTGHVERIEDLIPLLAKVRDDRPRIEPPATQPGSPTTPPEGGAAPGQRPTPPVQPDVPGVAGPEGGGPGSTEPGGQGPEPVQPEPSQSGGGVAPTGGSVEPGGGPGPTAPEAGTVRDRGTEGRLAELTGISVQKLEQGERELSEHGVFSDYLPQKVKIEGAQSHPTPLVEPTAMAAVSPVDPTYSPKLPKELIDSGALSDAQLENVIYAGQAHSQELPGGHRMGYFIGDGTGVGKGRQIAAIFLDNWNQGRKKGVWVSKSSRLIDDARRDFKDLGLDPKRLLDMKKNKGREILPEKEGVAFVPYSSLASQNPGIDVESVKAGSPKLIEVKDPKKQGRLHTLRQWLGPDFDGVIVFDEAHLAGNATQIKTTRGIKEPSARGMTVVDVQKLFPKARVVYASATGATDVTNLSYAERLGIWGHGTPFADKRTFFDQVTSGGLSAMEIVSRDLKAMGRYLARTLSFEGVTREKMVHQLTPEQTKIYNDLATAWQYVLSHRDETMARTNAARDSRALSRANAAFYGAQQRFYNQLLTALQMPSVIADAKEQLKKGNSVVMQVVNTNEATLARELAAKAGEAAEADDMSYLETLDLSPKDILLQYIDSSYPTALYEQFMDEEGNIRWRPVVDKSGALVLDPEAVKRKQELMDRMSLVKAPQNPLEMIMDTFGAENVAEVTGRSQRVVSKPQPDGSRKMVRELNRGEPQLKVEVGEFMDGKRRILVFSDAGGTGFSYHASRKAKNQQRRIHYLIQSGWRADSAMQGFGRTHRSDQASAPHYVLVSTDIKGHERFMSTIARRLAELGALTGGERKSAGGELFSEDNNLENVYAEDAVTRLFRNLHAGRLEGFEFNELSKQLGYTRTLFDEQTGELKTVNTLLDPKTGGLNLAKIPSIQQFLNRILSLQVGPQNLLFETFMNEMRKGIEAAKEAGSYDPGLQTLKALSIRKLADDVVYKHPGTTAETRLVEIEHDQPQARKSFEDADKIVKLTKQPSAYVQNIKSGKVFALLPGSDRTLENGQIIERYRRLGITAHDLVPKGDITTEAVYGEEPNYRQVTPEQAKQLWDVEYEKAPKQKTYRDTYLTGAFLPIWDRIKMPDPKIWRVTTDQKQTFLGAHVPDNMVEGLRQRLGAGKGAAETPASVMSKVLDRGQPIELANGWTIRRVRIGGENRIEVTGPGYDNVKEWEDHIGGFTERRDWKLRFFLPTDEKAGSEAMGKLLSKSPKMEKKTPPGDDLSRVPGMGFATKVEFSEPTIEDQITGNLAPRREQPANPMGTPSDASTLQNWHRGLDDQFQQFKGWMNGAAGKSAPKITLAGRDLGEKAVRWGSSRVAARPMAEVFAADVMSNSGVDPVKFGAALTEDNLRSVRESYTKAGDTEGAAKVKSFIGVEGFPFKTEAEYQDYLNDPVVKEVIERHKDLWSAVITPMYKQAQQLDHDVELPSRGLQTGARINLRAVMEGEDPKDVVRTVQPGNLLGTLRRKSPFGIRAKGTGEGYWLNYYDLMENTYGRQLEIANKNNFENELVKAGYATIGPPGQRVIIHGKPAKGFPLKQQRALIVKEGAKTKSISQSRVLYVDANLADEYRRIANVDAMSKWPGVGAVNKVLNFLAIASGTDATTHLKNQFTVLAFVPDGTGRPIIQDTIASLIPGRPDAFWSLAKAVIAASQDRRAQLAALAEIGALRETHPSTGSKLSPMTWAQEAIHYMDKGVRLVLDDAYENLVKQGLASGTETERREFINRLGQYNRRLQGPMLRFFRDTGLGPFVTAGRAFNVNGLRTMSDLFTGGVKPREASLRFGNTVVTTIPSAMALRANILAKWVGSVATVALLNWFLTRKKENGGPAGRPGIPLGDVDLGVNDNAGRMLHIPVLGWFGPTRGLRAIGLRGFAQSKYMGLPTKVALDAAWRDAFNTWTSPFAGPGIRFASVAATGYSPAINVPRVSPIVPPGENQFAENVKSAVIHASPISAGIHASMQPGASGWEGVESQVPFLAPQEGRTEEMMRNYPPIVRRAQAASFVEDVIGRARRMPPGERARYLLEQLNRLETDDDRKRALREFRFRKVI